MDKAALIKSLNDISKMSRVSNSSTFLQSLNSSGESSFLKRKLGDDSDMEGSFLHHRKESRIGSPMMSPWEFRRLRTDLIDAQAQIVRLEERIDQLHKKNKEAVIFFDQEKSEMRSNLENSRKTIESLEHKLQKVRSREAEVRTELADLRKENDCARLDKDQRIAELQADNDQLREKLGELEEGDFDRVAELKIKLSEVRQELQRQHLAADESRDIATNAQARLNVALEDLKDVENVRLELTKAQNRIQELESERDEWEEARTVATVLQDRVLRLRDVEKELTASQEEVARLRIAVNHKVVLEEKVHDLEVKLAANASRENEFISLQEKIQDLENELKRWSELAQQCCNDSSRAALQAHVTALNEKELCFTYERSNLLSEVESLKSQFSKAQEEIVTAIKASDELKQLNERIRTEGQLLRRKVILITRERDSYRQQLDLFEKDLTVSGIGKGEEESVEGNLQRVQQLETILQEYREHITTLENKLEVYKADDIGCQVEARRKVEQELAEARAENAKLSARRDELEQLLEQRVNQGGILSPSTKVLHFRNNPATLAEQKHAEDVAQLRQECDRLKARIRLLESGENLDLTAKAAADVENGATARIRELEEQLNSSQLKISRLREVFKKTSQDFRDVSYMLLGYRIDLVSNSKVYRLTNLYSNDPNDYFMFQLNRQGMMEMLETPYAESLSELVNEHLLRNNSIPCFLSAVTLALHQPASEAEDSDSSEGPVEVEISD